MRNWDKRALGALRGALKRVASVGAALLFGTLLIYGALYLTPGSAAQTLDPHASKAQQLVIAKQYHLNDSFINQYLHWLSRLFHGDLGSSIVYREHVTNILGGPARISLELVLYSGILVLLFGVGLGLVASIWERRAGTPIALLTGVGVAVPSYVAAVILIAVFAVGLGWFPVFGTGTGFGGAISHLTLPAIALSIAPVAYVAQLTRIAMSDELHSHHVETGRARGLPGGTIIRRHAVRNALIPITTASGVTIASLIAGSVVVDNAFSLNGLGSLLVASIQAKDFVVVQAIALIILVLFILITQLIDIAYPFIDPRVRGR